MSLPLTNTVRQLARTIGPLRLLLGLAGLGILSLALLIAMEFIAPNLDPARADGQNRPQSPPSPALVAQGAYLAKLGNCVACHSARGGEPYAGGKAIHTPFGAVFASNITPDPQHGIGRWSAEAFYRAMQRGIRVDGRLLTPAFPYPNFTQISRADSDALYAYFQYGVQPVAQPNKAHELRFPFNTQIALAAWRVLFFRAADPQDAHSLVANNAVMQRASAPSDIESQNVERGRVIVTGLAHCSACHGQRNALGASRADGLLSGALMPMQDWYAPSLHAREEAGVQHWSREHIVALLRDGVAPGASALGPMAEVVAYSTQHWQAQDLQAAAAYLQSLPVHRSSPASESAVPPALRARGAALYAQHCATCHGEQGQGLQETAAAAGGAAVQIPALAGNRAVSLPSSANLVRIILAGGYAPATAGNPRPYGMPPFVHVLDDEDIAALATYLRSSWGHKASAVSASEVVTQRRGVLQ
jgi:mono/diheme cytochrome c family protein